jgi:hypothetical protein
MAKLTGTFLQLFLANAPEIVVFTRDTPALIEA